ncbi:hypothetical protein C8J57DRAFT_1253350 [Mycena rebaudengoi]|nr:hypothetical protein C8J57DRAFT_1253350 [Mycena rebaudengoi]
MADGPAGAVGKQLANNLLNELAIHPDMPSIELCASHELYGLLEAGGTLYFKEWTPATEEWKEVEVHLNPSGVINRYHIIMAIVPPHWHKEKEQQFNDVSTAGFASTLGVASMKESLQNKIAINVARKLVKCGRLAKMCTGLPGTQSQQRL